MAATPGIGKTTPPPSLPSLGEPGVGERTRYYKRMYVGSRGKEVVRAPSPLPSENAEAATSNEGTGGCISPGSDFAFISPRRRRWNLQWHRGRDQARMYEERRLRRGRWWTTTRIRLQPPRHSPALPQRMWVIPWIVFANIESLAIVKPIRNFLSSNIIIECVQNANTIAVITARRQVKVPRMSVGGVGAALFMKVKAIMNLILLRSVRGWICIVVLTMSMTIGVSPWPTGARSVLELTLFRCGVL